MHAIGRGGKVLEKSRHSAFMSGKEIYENLRYILMSMNHHAFTAVLCLKLHLLSSMPPFAQAR